MKSTILIGILALFALTGLPAMANAKSTTHRHDQAVTGCLERGGNAGQYKLTGQDGTTWNVKQGQYVDLASYVGYTVTVAGPENTRHGDQLTALDVAVDSQSCSR